MSLVASPIAACRVCKREFPRRNTMQSVCGGKCAAKFVRLGKKAEKDRKSEEARQDKAKLEAMKGLPDLLKEAQRAVNAYVRWRDMGKACISCTTQLVEGSGVGGHYDAGHYRSIGSAPHLRFDMRNIHGQCKHCNQYLAGNPISYRAGLIERIGIDLVEELESDQAPRRYRHDELRLIRDTYKGKLRDEKRQSQRP